MEGIGSSTENLLSDEEVMVVLDANEAVFAAATHRAWSTSSGSLGDFRFLCRLASDKGWQWSWHRPAHELEKHVSCNVPADLDDSRNGELLKEAKRVLANLKVKVLQRGNHGYPRVFEQLQRPPELLYTRGSVGDVEPYAVTIVGTRKPTDYGRVTAERFARELAVRGVSIVSGLAYGIDSAAHKGAVIAGGRTVAVLGTGIDIVYPRYNHDLAQRILKRGALVSEFPLGQPPTRWTFPQRNRLVAALGQAIIVVQADRSSGTRHTVDFALELGRTVFAVPGEVNVRQSRGPHQLIRQGAKLLEEPSGVLRELGWDNIEGNADDKNEAGILPSSPLHAVLALVGTRPVSFDELFEMVEFEAQELQGYLLQLELAGAIRQLPGLRFIRIT